VDGKFLKGTPKNAEKQAVIHAVAHESRIDARLSHKKLT
jgi:hypothetical protein